MVKSCSSTLRSCSVFPFQALVRSRFFLKMWLQKTAMALLHVSVPECHSCQPSCGATGAGALQAQSQGLWGDCQHQNRPGAAFPQHQSDLCAPQAALLPLPLSKDVVLPLPQPRRLQGDTRQRESHGELHAVNAAAESKHQWKQLGAPHYLARIWPGTKATLSWKISFQCWSRNVMHYLETAPLTSPIQCQQFVWTAGLLAFSNNKTSPKQQEERSFI